MFQMLLITTALSGSSFTKCPFPIPPPPLATPILLSVSMDLSTLDPSYKWNPNSICFSVPGSFHLASCPLGEFWMIKSGSPPRWQSTRHLPQLSRRKKHPKFLKHPKDKSGASEHQKLGSTGIMSTLNFCLIIWSVFQNHFESCPCNERGRCHLASLCVLGLINNRSA